MDAGHTRELNARELLGGFMRAAMERPQQYEKWCYERGIMAKAALDAYALTGEAAYLAYARDMTDRFVRSDGSIAGYPAVDYNLDMLRFGAALPALYGFTGDERYVRACHTLLCQARTQPRTPQGGFWHKAIYPDQMWLDGVYMACPFLVAAAPLCAPEEENRLYDLVALQFTLIYQKTLDEASGLCRHAWDAAKQQPWAEADGRSPHVWGRAMGWFMMAHADVLEALPAHHPACAAIAAQMQTLYSALLPFAREGLWYQVTDRPEALGNYPESSCTAMFCYALAKGVRLGVLPAAARDAARASARALWAESGAMGEDALPSLRRICKVAGLGGTPYRDGSYAYYIGETVCRDDYKGTAPYIMALCELSRG